MGGVGGTNSLVALFIKGECQLSWGQQGTDWLHMALKFQHTWFLCSPVVTDTDLDRAQSISQGSVLFD